MQSSKSNSKEVCEDSSKKKQLQMLERLLRDGSFKYLKFESLLKKGIEWIWILKKGGNMEFQEAGITLACRVNGNYLTYYKTPSSLILVKTMA